MIRDADDLLRVLLKVYGTEIPPKPLHLLIGAHRVSQGQDSKAAAAEVGTQPRLVDRVREAPDPIVPMFGGTLPAPPERLFARARQSLAQLVIGNIAERVFERIYRDTLGATTEFALEDDRQGRTDTDYRVLNGNRRPVFRINIKFHGSLFRNAKTLVGLEPEDCFALATYKINNALLKQDHEHLPYLFVIVSVPGLTAAEVGKQLPEDLVSLAALAFAVPKIQQKRSIEDRIVDRLADDPAAFNWHKVWSDWEARISASTWNVLSARKAQRLLLDRLFERVYALRVLRFAQNYRAAEVDMHFSLADDLTPIDTFLGTLRDDGLQGLTVRLERGTF